MKQQHIGIVSPTHGDRALDSAILGREGERPTQRSASDQNIDSGRVFLAPHHLDSLRAGSAISDAVIDARGYRTVTDAHILRELGFAPCQRRVPGLLMPLWTVEGRNALQVYRPDLPRTRGGKRGSQPKVIKYELPAGCVVRLDCPPVCRPMLANPAIPLWFTEGIKKADALASQGLCAIALLGVWNFKGRNAFGGITLLADFDSIALTGRDCRIVFDSDVMQKASVRQALERLSEHLRRRQTRVRQIVLQAAADTKLGVDDYLAAGHTRAELEALADAPPPVPHAAPAVIELLDDAPAVLRRPLDLIAGHGYAVTWAHVRVTQTETKDNAGVIVRHTPPLVATTRSLLVMRDDGVLYGPTGSEPLEALGMAVELREPPRSERLWRSAALKCFRAGSRPVAVSVVERLVSIYDHFIDFGRSLGPQLDMCRMSACFSLATWLLRAFTVIGYPWPNGERGSGKSHWGYCWASTSYLGEFITAAGTFAALRDLADYGAALLFDDAENLSDPRRTDPDKRSLLLAGNRKGTSIPLKELIGDRWQIRWVNAFCPRGFTAIALPDEVLASRVVLIPLVRSADPVRSNADPADFRSWPCDHAALQDDLWALALSLLAEAETVWAEFERETETFGRVLQPWRPLLAVARLMDRHGVEGLEASIRRVMRAYQAERPTLLENDRPALVIRAVVALARERGLLNDTDDTHDGDDALRRQMTFTAADIVTMLRGFADASDTLTVDWATPMTVGHVLSHLRFSKERRASARSREVSMADLLGMARAHGVATDTVKNLPHPESVIAVTSVMSVTAEQGRPEPGPPEVVEI